MTEAQKKEYISKIFTKKKDIPIKESFKKLFLMRIFLTKDHFFHNMTIKLWQTLY